MYFKGVKYIRMYLYSFCYLYSFYLKVCIYLILYYLNFVLKYNYEKNLSIICFKYIFELICI